MPRSLVTPNSNAATPIARRAHSRPHGGPPRPYRAAVVTCDIVGHSSTSQHETMLERVRGINDVVGNVLDNHPPGSVLWASGGDGGHVLFLNDSWQASVLDLLRDLRAWAEREAVPLRIAAHYGPLEVIVGADGRLQPVGEAINTAAWILTRGSSAGIVVSSQFRAAAGSLPGVEFHDRRPLRSKHGRPQTVYVMSMQGSGRRSEWPDPGAADAERLRDAVERGDGLEAVYWAKRLMLVKGGDRDATIALAGLTPRHFRYNPILGQIGPGTLRKLIGAGQLIEFRYGDVICRRGDTGSTMFVILRGMIGVFAPDHGPGKNGAPVATHREGDIVGELAFALQRERTADLVSLGDTALLSFDYQQLSTLLHGQGERIWEFMTRRALEHVSQHVPYLVGRPLAALPEPERREWHELLSILESSCHIITQEAHKRVTLAEIRRRDRRRTAAGGIYILASGHLHSLSTEGKELDGGGFPLLYVDLPDQVVAPDHEYTVDRGPAKIIFIGLEAIDQLPSPVHARLVRQLKREVQRLYHYDAFISYNFADEPVAERWATALTRLGLRVFRDSPVRLGEPYPEKDARALLDALTMLVLVSPHAMVKDADRSWLLKEVRFRERHFERPRILPVQLPQGDPQLLDVMYSAIRAEGREADAIAEAAALIRDIRSGAEEAPHGLRRCPGTRIT
jgi:class 3 adenylate cyclase